MSKDVRPPQQQRSRETLGRLLRATIELLNTTGLRGATIPRIAAAANIAPASVYRRFRDKDALFRAAFLNALEQSAHETQSIIERSHLSTQTLEDVIGILINETLADYRSHPGLLRALVRFIEDDSDEAFKKDALASIARNFHTVIELLLGFREKITHPNPRRAITFGILSIVTIIEGRALEFEGASTWNELLPISDQELHRELTRSFLAYLQAP